MAIKKEKEKEKEKVNTGALILELVDKLHEDRKIPRETILGGIASAIQIAAERHFQVEEGVFAIWRDLIGMPMSNMKKEP